MSIEKFLTIVILACAARAVLAKPNRMAFDIAKDQTVCRTKVEYDTNEDRIPKTIKMLKCEDDPYVMCPTNDCNKTTPCCGAFSLIGTAKFSCTEVQDLVLVKNTKAEKEEVIMVAVGCSCIKQDPDKAKE